MTVARPYPLYTDGSNLYTSFDGGATLITLENAGAIVQTAAPVSGDGSSGSKVTIADGAIGLAKLATQATKTIVANNTGGTAGPTAVGIDSTVGFTASGFGVAGWWADSERFLKAQVSTMTEFVPWKAGANPVGGPTTLVAGNGADGSVEGGAIASAGNVAVPFSTAMVWMNPKTSGFVVEFDAKFAAVSSNQQVVGISSGTQDVIISALTSTDATHWFLQLTSDTPVVLSVLDTNIHNFAITFDGTTCKAWIDRVLVGSTTTLTGMPTGASRPYVYGAAASQVAVRKAEWGYIA